MADRDNLIVGIDLGTTFSLVAYADERGPRVIRDENGDGRLPSVIGFVPEDSENTAHRAVAHGEPAGSNAKLTIGWTAREHAVENPRATVHSIKRLIGKGLEDIQRELPFLAYQVRAGQRDSITVDIDGRQYTPQEISAAILQTLRDRAEKHLGRPVTKAVITVPAYFDDAQRQATRDAGRIAGLDVVRIINEPTAAALAYGLGARGNGFDEHRPARSESGHVSLPIPKCSDKPDENSATPAEFSGQIVAVYDLGGGTFDVSILRIEDGVFQVISTAGDTRLGGDDFDREIITAVSNEVQAQFGVSIDSPRTRQLLRSLSESVKIRLSEHAQADVEFDLGQNRIYRRTFTRHEFERMVTPLIDRTLDACKRALRDAGLRTDDVQQIVLAGGSTRMPLVRSRVQEFFGRVPYTALNPDEVVALGAALQASILSGGRRDMLLLDVTPLSLGIETLGGAMGKLIMRNTAIPTRATESFTTYVDGQTAIKINVLQGERELAADCRSLGQFELRGIPPMPAGIPKVEVEFLIDANGILIVSARELRSGQKAGIQIIPSHGLTREEVDRIAADSVRFAKSDLDAHRRIDLVNQVGFDTHKTEQMLQQYGHLLDQHERQRIQTDMAALRQMAQTATADLDELHRALDAFGKGTQHLAEVGVVQALR